jgi:hypothetical protein
MIRNPENPYQSPTVPGTDPKRRALRTVLSLGAIIGSVILVLLGCAVAALGMLPSDAPQFFLLCGAHLIASGAFGAIGALATWHGGLRYLFGWTSMIVNAALVVWIVMLVLNGTVRGPLVVAAPLLLGLPAAINVVAAVSVAYRKD